MAKAGGKSSRTAKAFLAIDAGSGTSELADASQRKVTRQTKLLPSRRSADVKPQEVEPGVRGAHLGSALLPFCISAGSHTDIQ
jgi:hypothetical protein